MKEIQKADSKEAYSVITDYLTVLGSKTIQKIKQENVSNHRMMNKIDELMNQIENLLSQNAEAK